VEIDGIVETVFNHQPLTLERNPMNKYVLMLAAAGLIAAAPAYYAFQAQADEGVPAVTGEAAAPAPEASAEVPKNPTEEAAPETAEPAAGEAAPAKGTNE
jgi:hypothetical protein